MYPAEKLALSPWARFYMLLMVLSGIGILGFGLLSWQRQNLLPFALYLALAVAASALKFKLPGFAGPISVHYLFVLIGIAGLDLPRNLLAAAACTLTQCVRSRIARPKAVILAFNAAASAVASACGYLGYHSLLVRRQEASIVAGMFFAAAIYFLVNTISVAGVAGAGSRKGFWKFWRENFLVTAPQYLMSAALAGLIRIYIDHVGWQWSLVATPAMFLIYSSYRLYLRRLEEEKRHVSQIADLHLRTIEALAVAIEAKDAATHAHLQRVQVYAVEIARELGASPAEIEALRAAALLHDIGKLAVPEYILSKPGRLTPEEFEKIKIHPEVGAEILRHVRFPYPVVPIVAAHHEKWDGSGYPYGLRGEEIPLGARILSAVDCLDALATDRHYRRAIPLPEAMESVAAQAGSSFDPSVIDVLRRRYRELEALAGHATPSGGMSTKESVGACRATPDAGFEQAAAGEAVDPSGFASAIAAAREEFQMLHEVTSELGTSLNMEGTLSLLGARLKSIVPHDAIAIYVRAERKLVPQYVHGRDTQHLRSMEVPVGRGLSGWVAENRKPILNGNPSVEPCYDGNPATHHTLNSAISVPLIGVNGVVGVLTLYHSGHNAFTRDHLRLLLAISSKAALTLENALHYRDAQKSAVTDQLTGLPNTRSMFLHLAQELARCARTNSPLAVLVIDLDGFKMVNDRFGHLAGNEVLKLVAQGLRTFCREYDYVARMGGDEFVIIVPGMKPGAVKGKALDLSAMVLEAGRTVTGEDILSLSVGEAFFPDDGSDTEELLAEADRRMYQVKRSHRAGGEAERPLEEFQKLPVPTAAIQ